MSTEMPMSTGMKVRRAGEEDLAAVIDLVEEFCAADGHDFEVARITTALRPLLRDDRHGQVWLLADGPAAIGYAVMTWGWSLESGGREALVDELYVNRRGTGLGSQLMTRAIQEARTAGAMVIFLETEAHNDGARRFYQRHGFTADDSVWMSRTLEGTYRSND